VTHLSQHLVFWELRISDDEIWVSTATILNVCLQIGGYVSREQVARQVGR
jgi:hypothetical protein